MTNGERIHQLADSHAQGSHDSDEHLDCYDCYPWINGYGARVLASLSANTDCKPEWWHSGGGIMGIHIDHKGKNYFVGTADEPNVGMDVNLADGTSLGSAEFGSENDYEPSDMAKRIWDGIENGVGVTLYEPETPFDGQLESRCVMCQNGLNHEVHYPSGNAVENKENQ
jgi:hypothetical protein